MTFQQWLMNQNNRNDYIGHMATQLAGDKDWQALTGEVVNSPARCLHHLEIHDYPEAIRQGMDEAWRAYHERFYPGQMYTKFRVYE